MSMVDEQDDKFVGLADVLNSCSLFGIPPTKPEIKKYFGHSLRKEWRKQFETVCYDVPFFAEVSFHTILGALPNVRNIRIKVGNNEEDCRVHSILLMQSGAGKGGGFSFSHMVAERLQLNFCPSGDMTNSAITGTFGEDKEFIPGYLHPDFDGGEVDIFASSEASQVIDTSNSYYDRNALNNLQKCMNRMGTVDNVLSKKIGTSREVIEFNSSATLYLTTYPPKKLFSTITQTGLLQRMITLHVPVTLEDKIRVGIKHLDMLENYNIPELERTIHKVVDPMQYINDFYQGVKSLSLTDDAKRILKDNVIMDLYKPLEGVEPETANELQKFSTRYQVLCYKIAWHSAISRLSLKVEPRDVAYAKSLIIPIFRSLIAFMEEEYMPDKQKYFKSKDDRALIITAYEKIASNTGKKRPWVYKNKLEDIIEEIGGITSQTARLKIDKYRTALFNTKKHRGSTILRLKVKK